MDDFSDNITTTALYEVGNTPFEFRSDFANDGDWIKINRLKRYYNYKITRSVRNYSQSDFTLHDLNRALVAPLGTSITQGARTSYYSHVLATGPYFAALTTSPADGNQSTDISFEVRTYDDRTDEARHALEFRPHNGYVTGAIERSLSPLNSVTIKIGCVSR